MCRVRNRRRLIEDALAAEVKTRSHRCSRPPRWSVARSTSGSSSLESYAPSQEAAARAEYERRLNSARAAEAFLKARDARLANARLGVFALAVVIGVFAWRSSAVSAAWLGVPIAAFIALAIIHDRVAKALRRERAASEWHQWGLERIDDRWMGRGRSGALFRDESHPYAEDLDLFGAGSLFERLSTARTGAGEQRLADWLKAPATPEVIENRQRSVAELRPLLDLREDMAAIGARVAGPIDTAGLAAWGQTVCREPRVWEQAVVAALGLANLCLALAALFGSASLWPLLATLAISAIFVYWRGKRLKAARADVARRSGELGVFSDLLARLEREHFQSPGLALLRERLVVARGPRASSRIARLRRWVDLLDSERNLFFAPFAALLLWRVQIGLLIERWRAESGPRITAWIDAIAEFEALASLAGYAFENPSDPNPAIVTGAACFVAESIGHPLLPRAACVRNDVALGGESAPRLLLVSGSNMSGKSTLLRTVGVNAVLAFAGAPVRAKSLRISPMAIGATLSVHDSLQAGRSRFYAEIVRIKQVVELTRGSAPTLFLIDELLHGTNSNDRRIGAEGILKGLIDRGAIGLATTHDLALTELADSLTPRAINVHFRDDLIEGKLHFDYAMRPGVVQKSNAIALMRAVGLEV